MKRAARLFVLALAATPLALPAQTAVSRWQLPPECAERDADPEKCVIQDGPPLKPIVRRKQPSPVPPAQPKPPPEQQAPLTREGVPR